MSRIVGWIFFGFVASFWEYSVELCSGRAGLSKHAVSRGRYLYTKRSARFL